MASIIIIIRNLIKLVIFICFKVFYEFFHLLQTSNQNFIKFLNEQSHVILPFPILSIMQIIHEFFIISIQLLVEQFLVTNSLLLIHHIFFMYLFSFMQFHSNYFYLFFSHNLRQNPLLLLILQSYIFLHFIFHDLHPKISLTLPCIFIRLFYLITNSLFFLNVNVFS